MAARERSSVRRELTRLRAKLRTTEVGVSRFVEQATASEQAKEESRSFSLFLSRSFGPESRSDRIGLQIGAIRLESKFGRAIVCPCDPELLLR